VPGRRDLPECPWGPKFLFMVMPKQQRKKTWKDRLPRCFGNLDQKFASQPADEKRANAMIREAQGAGASNHEILNAIRVYLATEGARYEHIEKQMPFVRKLLDL
jgi:hypothetical protein